METALVLPVLLLVLCAILDFGWIFANTYRAEHAAGLGARYAVLNANDLTQAELECGVREKVLDNVWSKEENTLTAVSVSGGSITVTVNSKIKTLTFVANTIFGEYYNTDCSVTAAY